MPEKFGCYWAGNKFGATIQVYPDGSVNVNHGGIEIGQGINTKVAQAVAMKLQIPLSLIKVTSNTTIVQPNNSGTGGSTTSEMCVQAAMNACDILLTRLAPFMQSGLDWIDLITQANNANVDLQAKGWFVGQQSSLGPQQYQSTGAAVAEVEVDILTGQYQVLRVDILFDAGVSMNPGIQI